MKYPIPHAGALAAFLLGACVTAAAAAAGQNQPPADPADANAPVPSTRYVPALGAPPASPSPVSPADNWKALNKTVASYDSMSLTMDMAEPKPAERASAEPSAPGAASKPPDAHSHHPQKESK